MRRKRVFWIFGLVIVLAVTLCAVFTGGIAISNRDWFGGQRNIILAEGLKSDVWLAPRNTEFSIPFLLHYFGGGRPFSLRLQIWDASKQYVAIEIAETRLTYSDGDSSLQTSKWSRKLKPHTQYNSSSSGIIQTEMFMLSDHISNLVGKHKDVTVTLTGHLRKANGEVVDFSVSEDFKARSDSDISTFWEVMAGV